MFNVFRKIHRYLLLCCIRFIYFSVIIIKLYCFHHYHFTGIQLLTLLVPILIGFLLDSPSHSLKSNSKYCGQLHEQSLQWLMRIGPKYPQEFKALMSQSPAELRMKLEAAIRYDQQSTNQKLKMDSHSAAAKSQVNQPNKPTIELKTNFSNFSSN